MQSSSIAGNGLQLPEGRDLTTKFNMKNKIMNTDKTPLEPQKPAFLVGAVMRCFLVEDVVEYRPYETCSKKDISGKGKISEVLGDGYYRVLFGDYERKNLWWSNGKYHWTMLWLVK